MTNVLVSGDAMLGECGDTVRLNADVSHHLRTVLRVKPDDKVGLLDGAGHKRTARIVEVSKHVVACCMTGDLETVAKPSPKIVLFQCIVKPARMDWLIEKAVEIGVSKIVPVISARTVVRVEPGERQARWDRITSAALCQSGNAWAPDIAPPVKWADALAQFADMPTLIAALFGDTRPIADVLLSIAEKPLHSVGFVVGPEGDFTDAELHEAVTQCHAIPVSLGANILRAETAALYGVSAISAMLRR